MVAAVVVAEGSGGGRRRQIMETEDRWLRPGEAVVAGEND